MQKSPEPSPETLKDQGKKKAEEDSREKDLIKRFRKTCYNQQNWEELRLQTASCKSHWRILPPRC